MSNLAQWKDSTKAWISQNKILTIAILVFVLSSLLYLLLFYPVIKTLYFKEAPIGFLNRLLKGQKDHSLEFYLKRFTIFFFTANVNFIFLAFGLSYFVRHPIRPWNLVKVLTRASIDLQQIIVRHRKILGLGIVLFLGFWMLYIGLGTLMIKHYGATLFGADHGDWARLEWQDYHKGSHPLILLMLAPFRFLKVLQNVPGLPLPFAAIILNSFFGASSNLLATIFFWNLTRRIWLSLGLSTFLNLTMAHLIFGTILESYSLAACSIIATYILFIICLRNRQLYLSYWILAGLFTFGVTITNFAQSLICFVLAVWLFQKENKLATVLEYLGAIFAISLILNLIQKALIGGTYFFLPTMVSREVGFIKTSLFNQPLLTSWELIKNFLLINFVGVSPLPEPLIPGVKIIFSFFNRSMRYHPIGIVATLLWLGVFFQGLYRNFQGAGHRDTSRALFIAVLAGIGSNLALHCWFGVEEMFLYTCNFTFLVLLLAVNKVAFRSLYFKLACLALFITMAINNFLIYSDMIRA